MGHWGQPPHTTPCPGGRSSWGCLPRALGFTVWLSRSAWGTPWQPLINSTSTFGVHNPLADMVVLREASFPALSLNPSLFAFVPRARQYLSSLLLNGNHLISATGIWGSTPWTPNPGVQLDGSVFGDLFICGPAVVTRMKVIGGLAGEGWSQRYHPSTRSEKLQGLGPLFPRG